MPTGPFEQRTDLVGPSDDAIHKVIGTNQGRRAVVARFVDELQAVGHGRAHIA